MPHPPKHVTLKLADNPDPDLEFTFPLNPSDVRIRKSNLYAQVPVAMSYHRPEEWQANAPDEITLDFLVIPPEQRTPDEGPGTDGERSIERLLGMLEVMRQPSDRPPYDPPELLIDMGGIGDALSALKPRVRIVSLDIQVLMWTPRLKPHHARVSMLLHTVPMGRSKGRRGQISR